MKIKKLSLVVLFALPALAATAQESISVDAPRVVPMGAPFRVEFSMNDQPDGFTAPDFAADGFEILAGPSTSQSTSISIVNGKTERSSVFMYTYVLVAHDAGNKQIGTASAGLRGKSISSKPLKIEVVNEGGAAGLPPTTGGRQPQQQQKQAERVTSPQQQIKGNDLVLQMFPSKREVYEGEPIVMKVRILSAVDLVNAYLTKAPVFEGFWTQELNREQQEAPKREAINNRVYDVYDIAEYLVFPQKRGQLTIEPITADCLVRITIEDDNGSDSPFSLFFGSVRTQTVTMPITSQRVKVNVKPFEGTATASYTGAVGSFNMNAELSHDILEANNSGYLKITISGTGNLPLIGETKIELPSTFELYKTKSTENINVSANGISGKRTYEYPFIARAKGDYTIAPVEFTYFDTKKQDFVTLRSEPMRISVTGDSSVPSASQSTLISGLTKEELKLVGSDIGYIKVGKPRLHPTGALLICSPLYIVFVGVMLLLFIVIVVYFRERIKASKDIARQKSKKASRAALGRLKEAKKSMTEGNKATFYQNILKAMWGYAGDKLNVPYASLTRNNICEILTGRGIDLQIVEEFREVIAAAEEAQYAPSGSKTPEEIYQRALAVITKLDGKL